MIDKARIVRLTRELIQAKSENPPGEEHDAAMLVKKELESAGLDVSVHEYEKGRPNIVAVLKSRDRPVLLVNTHIDTVPAGTGWRYPPFSATLKAGKIYGRGASDCKGNTASCIEAIRSIVEEGTRLGGTLVFSATVDEEMGSKAGLEMLLSKNVVSPDAAFIVDSDDYHIDIAQKGLLHLVIKIYGKKAHGAYPHFGDNALVKASEIITKLSKIEFQHKSHPLLNPPTINVGTISGGDKINMVPDSCEFGVDIRYLPGMEKDQIIISVKDLIESVTKNYDLLVHQSQEPYEIRKTERLVECVFDSIKEVRGKAEHTGVSGATMVTLFRDRGIPAVSTGFGRNECMHATDEYVVVDELVDGAKVVKKTIEKYLGVEK